MHMWSKNGTRTPYLPQPIEISQGQKQDIGKPCGCVLVAHLLVMHPVKFLPMVSHLGNMGQMPHTDFFDIYFYIYYCIHRAASSAGSLWFLV